MPNELIIDSGFLIALLSKTDQFHKKAISLQNQIKDRKWVTTWPVMTEVSHILYSRNHSHVFPKILLFCQMGGLNLFQMTSKHIPNILENMEKYKSLPMDLADASIVILAEELRHGDIVSTDTRDFNTFRWKNTKPFNNLFIV